MREFLFCGALLQLAKDPYQKYWKYVPEEMQPKLHFYNFAISGNHNSPSYPMNIIRSVYKPGVLLSSSCQSFSSRVKTLQKWWPASNAL